MKILRYKGLSVVYLLASRKEFNTTIQKPLRKANFFMNKEKIKEKVYLTGRVRELITLNKKERFLIPTKNLETIPKTILRILIKGC